MDDSLLRPPQLVEFVRRDIIGVTLVQMLPVRFLTAVRGGRTRKVIFPSLRTGCGRGKLVGKLAFLERLGAVSSKTTPTYPMPMRYSKSALWVGL